MLFIRSLFFLIGATISLVVIVIFALIILPFSNVKQRYALLSKWAKFCVWLLSITNNIRVKVVGKENISSKPCVIMSNHQSTFETILFQTVFPHQTWVLKRELLWIPFFGWGMAVLDPILINRSNKIESIKKVIKLGKDRIKKGISVVVFPEGTRKPYKELGKYQNGGAAIAKSAECEIIPVYHNSGKLWPKGRILKTPGVITVVIGKTVSMNNKTVSKVTSDIRLWTQDQENKIDS